jgi:trigger factor
MASTEHPGQDEPISPLEDGVASPQDDVSPVEPAVDVAGVPAEAAEVPEEEEAPRLSLEVDIQPRSACERHIVVRVSRDDIERYFDKEFSELVTTAHVPGFRPGRAPRKLIETRFRKEIKDKVKSNLLLDSIAQISKEYDLAAISEPDFQLDAVELPDQGPMTYEFDLEVRPEFDLPDWKGLTIERPVREFTDDDVDRALKDRLAQYGTLVPHDGPAEVGDYVFCRLTFTHEGQVLSSSDEELIRIRPVLSFHDGRIERFDELMKGVRAGQTRVGEAQLSDDAPNEQLRGRKVTATFEVKEVKRLQLPELTPEFVRSLGDFGSVAVLRDAVRDNLNRQLVYEQHRRVRRQITDALTASASWELPPGLLRRQSQRELERVAMELRRAGFTDQQILAQENSIRQNSTWAVARALKEHFILEKIAEVENIDATDEDYDQEIELIALQSEETPRRVRARLEKAGRMDVLRNQIVERKVIERILSHAKFVDTPYQPEALEEEAMDRAAAGGEPESPIPEATAEGT